MNLTSESGRYNAMSQYCMATLTKTTQEILWELTQAWIHTVLHCLAEIICIFQSGSETQYSGNPKKFPWGTL